VLLELVWQDSSKQDTAAEHNDERQVARHYFSEVSMREIGTPFPRNRIRVSSPRKR